MDFEKIREESKRVFSSAKGSHDWDHTERVYNLCMHIGRKENADLNILALASILHDIGRKYEDESLGTMDHAEKGARMAADMLRNHGLAEDRINEIVHCIQSHRFRGKKIPKTLEAKILFDADKLDSIGAVGIGRAFLFVGEVGARLHDKNIDVEKTKSYTRNDTAYREFLVKLRKIRGSMFTAEGKRIAEERHRFMDEFFDRINKEVDGTL